MKRLLTCLALVATIASAKDRPNPHPRPRGNEASFIESYSPTEVTIKATGIGQEPELADADVARVAVDFVLFKWTDRLVSVETEKKGIDPVLDEIYREPRPFITWTADKVTATRKLANGEYAITRMIRVSKGALNDFLASKGVLVSREDLAEAVGNPSIMVIPDAPKGQNPLDVFDKNLLAQQMSGSIESYLTARQYEVKNPRAIENINEQIDALNKAGGVDGDASYKIALLSGSDIYITFSGTVQSVPGGRKASLTIRAFETTTGRTLGTETGYSQTRPNTTDQALDEEASNDAIDKVLQRLTNYWKTEARKGAQYKVVFNVVGHFDERTLEKIKDNMEDLVDQEFPGSKQNIFTDKTMDYTLLAPRAKYNTANRLVRRLRDKLEMPGVRVKSKASNGRLVSIDIVNDK